MKRSLLLFLLLFLFSESYSQNYYWVAFSDKNNTKYSFQHPEDFLSDRAIQRRINQNISIDSLDFPVNQNYIDSVLSLEVEFVHASKWLNGITVQANIENFESLVKQFPFVTEVQLTKPAEITKSAFNKFHEFNYQEDERIDTSKYGNSVFQTSIMNGQFLHNQNYLGQGMHIAVLDGGFTNVNNFEAFDSLWINDQILGTKDFVDPTSDIFGSGTHYHGMSVLSCMGGNVPGELLGTSPKASFWLLRSEDTYSEYKIEEDNWAVAAEFADSVGVDIINSSLGYFLFDDENTNHSYADMDGKTTRVTKAANIAANKGILVFSSAGNEGNDPWKYILAPSDGDHVIGVAAVDKNGSAAPFTSYGPASDGGVKPDVAALGWNTFLQKSNGNLDYGSGTSYASPVLAGMAACLWQAIPYATAQQVKDAIIYSGHLIQNPDERLGFGIPDFEKAYVFLLNMATPEIERNLNWKIYPNPFSSRIIIQNKSSNNYEKITLELYSVQGSIIKTWSKTAQNNIELNDFGALKSGIYLLQIKSTEYAETFKLTKTN